jgi:periplasmic protein TonB
MAAKKTIHYQPETRPLPILRVLLYGLGFSLATFLMLPITQWLQPSPPDKQKLRQFNIAPPPPPPPPDIEEPPPEEVKQDPPPPLQEPPPPMNLSQLNMALNPGFGDAVSGALGIGGFAVQPDAVADMKLFEVEELDEMPRPVYQVRMEVPNRFRQERVSGLVKFEIRIDEQGQTHVLKVVESSNPELIPPAREAVRQWRWTPPTKGGEAVSARYVLPIGFKF